MLREEEARKKVKTLKRFYIDIINFIIGNALLALIWLTFDKTGTFWPKYVLLVWGLILIFRACRLRILPLIFPHISFLSDEWEEKKVKEILRHRETPLNKDEKEK